ncbi:hypothetical protein O3M35_011609 [Rhynocoris fuscipes]|uniref:Uncharacterized protein n=1 Tax=Rhynocoris fuscipes TaxID=488301 RepID=A0AAW1D322_9HEMI
MFVIKFHLRRYFQILNLFNPLLSTACNIMKHFILRYNFVSSFTVTFQLTFIKA